jgi:hypothetical protein
MATAKKSTAPAPAANPAPEKSAAPATKKPVAGKKAPTTTKAAVGKKAVPAKAPAAPKADKPKKPKLVRDSFTIPKDEYVVLEVLKQRAAKLGQPAKKSEVLRAGVKALAAMPDAGFAAALAAVPAVKTGRPAKTD